MDLVGGTFVGGSSSGWEIVDPNANAAALGLFPSTPAVTAPVYGGGMPAMTAPAVTYPNYGGTLSFGGGYGAAPAPVTPGYDPYAAAGTVGGSWSPEPAGNNQILYGHYSASGAVTMPQAFTGQQLSAAAPTTPQTTPAQPTTTGGGQTQAQQQTKPKKDATKAEPKEPKKPATVTVKAGDTLSEIAASKGISWQKLYELNKGVIGGNPNLIRPGQVLKLP